MTFQELLNSRSHDYECDRKDCIHREAFRRLLKCDGGLELCPLFDE